MSMDEVEMYSKINHHLSHLKFVRFSPLGEGKNLSNPKDVSNIEKRKPVVSQVIGYILLK